MAFCFFGKPLDIAGTIHDLALGLGQGFAHFSGQDRGQIVDILYHQIMPLAQDRTPLLACLGRPARLGIICAIDGTRHIFDTKIGHICNLLSGRRIEDRKAIAGLDPVPIHIGAGLEKRRIVQFQHDQFSRAAAMDASRMSSASAKTSS